MEQDRLFSRPGNILGVQTLDRGLIFLALRSPIMS
jgi:hypothetical protein